MRRRILVLIMTVTVLMAQMGAASACNFLGYQPPTPKSLQK